MPTVAENKQRIEELLAKQRYKPAIRMLQKLAALKDPKFAKYAQWAKQQLPKAKSGHNAMLTSLDSIHRTADDLFQRFDYAQAAEILDSVPANYHTPESKQLLDDCNDNLEEIVCLQDDIDRAIARKKYDDLLPTVERMLELKPSNSQAKRLRKELKTYGGKGGSLRLGDRSDQRFDEAGSSIGPLKIVMLVSIPLLVFGGVGYMIKVYLDGNSEAPSNPFAATDESVTSADDSLATTSDSGTTAGQISDGGDPALVQSVAGGSLLSVPSSGQSFVIGDGTRVGYWDPFAGKTINWFSASVEKTKTLAISDDAKLAATGSNDGMLTIWDVEAGKSSHQINLTSNQSGDRDLRGLSFSADGTQLLVTTARSMVLLNSSTGQEVASFPTMKDANFLARISPDGKYALSGHWDSPGKKGYLQLWSMQTRQPIRRLDGHVHYVRDIKISPDSRRAVSGGRGTLHYWDLENGAEIRRIELPSRTSDKPSNLWAYAVAISPDGLKALTGGSGTLSLWNLENGEELRRFEKDGSITNVAFMPDGQHIAAAGRDNTVYVFDTSK